MTEIDETDDDVIFEDDFEDESDAFIAAPPAPVRSGPGWGAVLPLFLLAGFGGAVGGWALTQYIMPKFLAPPAAQVDAPIVDLAPLTARLETAEKKLAAQSSELSFLSSEIKSGAASVTVGGVDGTLDITPLMNRLSDMEAKLERAEKRSAGSAGPNSSDADMLPPDTSGTNITAGFADLKSRLLALENNTSQSQNSMSEDSLILPPDLSEDLDALRLRVAELETSVDEARALAATPTIVRDTVLLPPLPREALLDAMVAPRDQEAQSWIGKTLKKHISVRDPEEVARASKALDEVESLIETQNYAGALRLIEAQPSDVRSVAAEWIRAVKAELETR